MLSYGHIRGTVTGHRRVAIEVLVRAHRDFLGDVSDYSQPPRTPMRRLTRLRRRIEAGRFLLERTDDVVGLWFGAAGMSVSGTRYLWRVATPDRYAMLAALREEEAELARATEGAVAC